MKRLMLSVIAVLIWALIILWQRAEDAEYRAYMSTSFAEELVERDIARIRGDGYGWATADRVRS